MFVFTLSASMRQNSPILLFFLWMYGIICLFSANLIMCTCGMQRSSGGDPAIASNEYRESRREGGIARLGLSAREKSQVTPTRRHFLGAFAAATMKVAPASGRYLRKIGLQLYTVRDLLSTDFEGTLREIARLGYQEVEFAGVLGPNLKQTRNLLGQLDLSAPSLHIDYNSLRKHTDASFETATALAAKFVVCPWLDPSERQTADDWKRVCENLNSIGELATHSGLTFAYHNHDFEFSNLPGGVRPFDLLLAHTNDRFVKFELDVYWAKKGNVDAVAYLKAHKSRFRLVHLKDMAMDGADTEIGNGTIDFGEIIVASIAGGVRHFFVEQDYSSDPMQSIKASISYLRHYR
jgi:sugar phosphate isomerase/epimerase